MQRERALRGRARKLHTEAVGAADERDRDPVGGHGRLITNKRGPIGPDQGAIQRNFGAGATRGQDNAPSGRLRGHQLEGELATAWGAPTRPHAAGAKGHRPGNLGEAAQLWAYGSGIRAVAAVPKHILAQKPSR